MHLSKLIMSFCIAAATPAIAQEEVAHIDTAINEFQSDTAQPECIRPYPPEFIGNRSLSKKQWDVENVKSKIYALKAISYSRDCREIKSDTKKVIIEAQHYLVKIFKAKPEKSLKIRPVT